MTIYIYLHERGVPHVFYLVRYTLYLHELPIHGTSVYRLISFNHRKYNTIFLPGACYTYKKILESFFFNFNAIFELCRMTLHEIETIAFSYDCSYENH